LRDDRRLMDSVDPDEYVLGQVPAPIAVVTDDCRPETVTLSDRLQPAYQKGPRKKSGRWCRIGAEAFVAEVRGRPRGAPPRRREPRS